MGLRVEVGPPVPPAGDGNHPQASVGEGFGGVGGGAGPAEARGWTPALDGAWPQSVVVRRGRRRWWWAGEAGWRAVRGACAGEQPAKQRDGGQAQPHGAHLPWGWLHSVPPSLRGTSLLLGDVTERGTLPPPQLPQELRAAAAWRFTTKRDACLRPCAKAPSSWTRKRVTLPGASGKSNPFGAREQFPSPGCAVWPCPALGRKGLNTDGGGRDVCSDLGSNLCRGKVLCVGQEEADRPPTTLKKKK